MVNGPAVKPFAEKSYDDIRKWESEASAAAQALQAVGDIRGIMSQLDGGRYEQALSYIQEYAPRLMPQGAPNLVAARQAFSGAVQPLMAQNLEMMRGLGAMSEKEFQAAMEALPKFGQDKAATDFLTGLVERKSKPIYDRAVAAREYMNTPEFEQSGFLRFDTSRFMATPNSAPNPKAAGVADPLGIR